MTSSSRRDDRHRRIHVKHKGDVDTPHESDRGRATAAPSSTNAGSPKHAEFSDGRPRDGAGVVPEWERCKQARDRLAGPSLDRVLSPPHHRNHDRPLRHGLDDRHHDHTRHWSPPRPPGTNPRAAEQAGESPCKVGRYRPRGAVHEDSFSPPRVGLEKNGHACQTRASVAAHPESRAAQREGAHHNHDVQYSGHDHLRSIVQPAESEFGDSQFGKRLHDRGARGRAVTPFGLGGWDAHRMPQRRQQLVLAGLAALVQQSGTATLVDSSPSSSRNQHGDRDSPCARAEVIR